MSWRVPVANESRNILGSQALGSKSDSAGHNSIVGMLKMLVNSGMIVGQPWFVDSVSGLATYDGKAFTQAKATIATAVALAAAGDTIFLRGSFSEAVSCALAGVRFIGVGTAPLATTWTGAADAKCLTLSSTSCLVRNIKFRPPAYGSGIPCAIALTAATAAVVEDCLFQGQLGSWYGLYISGSSGHLTIRRNKFVYLNTATYGSAIVAHTYTTAEPNNCLIEDNIFHSNTNHVVLPLRDSVIRRNLFADYGLGADNSSTQTVKHLCLADGTVGRNHVYDNMMEGLYDETAASYTHGPNDCWIGNRSQDVAATTVVDAGTGTTKALPPA